MQPTRTVFVTGGTGYLGHPLIVRLISHGHRVRALARATSASKLPPRCEVVVGDALDSSSYDYAVPPADTFVQLVGVSHPSPAKALEFRSIDLVSGKAGLLAASAAQVEHFVYLSVAHPAPVMKAFIEVRAEVEAAIYDSGINSTILRPWYVLGPGHRWPYALIPLYWVMRTIPATREGAQRLGLITCDQMVTALVDAIENPPHGVRVVEVPELRSGPKRTTGAALSAS